MTNQPIAELPAAQIEMVAGACPRPEDCPQNDPPKTLLERIIELLT